MLANLESHLSRCEACRDFLEDAASKQEESRILREVAGWKPEQAEFQPVLETALDASFRIARRLDPTEFPFVEGARGRSVSGKIDSLQLNELIGAGGMGAVFRAFDPELERDVAVKVLRPEFAGHAEVGHLFLDEARAAAALQHENVLPIYHVSRDESGIFSFAMPVIEGGSLDEVLKTSGGSLDPDGVIDIAIKMSRALAAAHESGIVHRDVKPANVLIEKDGPGVWLTDFGLARAASHGFGEGTVVGTPGYAAPEVMQGRAGTASSDLFSLGVLLREMITGKHPDPFSPNQTAQPLPKGEYPDWFLDIVESLLRSNPDERPASASVLLEKLESGRDHDDRKGIAKESGRAMRAKVRTVFWWTLAVVFGLFVADLLLGARATNASLRKFLGRPLSVDGSVGAYNSLEKALGKREGDLQIRIAPGSEIEMSEALVIRDRVVSLHGIPNTKTELLVSGISDGTFVSVDSGGLEMVGISLKYQMNRFDTVDSVIRARESRVRIENAIVRREASGGPGGRNPGMGATFFSVEGDSVVELSNVHLSSERRGKGFLVEATENASTILRLEEIRFTGERFSDIVFSGSEEKAGTAEVSVSMDSSTVYGMTAFRFDESATGIQKTISTRRNLIQCNGPLVTTPVGAQPLFRDTFSFEEEGSIISVGGPVAVGPPEKEARRGTSTSPEDAEAAAANWEEFWSRSGKVIMTETQWVPWILDFSNGRSPNWNPAIDRSGVGAAFDSGEEAED